MPPVNIGLAQLSDHFLLATVFFYALAVLAFAGDFAFGRRTAPRVADKLNVTLTSPPEFAGSHVQAFVWNDNGQSQIWLPGSNVAFPAFNNMLLRNRAVFPLSHVTSLSR